jgi:hypothetical protein
LEDVEAIGIGLRKLVEKKLIASGGDNDLEAFVQKEI